MTILEMGEKIKKLPDYDPNRWVKRLERELARLIACSKENDAQWQKMYQENPQLKRAIRLDRAMRAYREYLYETSIVRGQLWYDVYRNAKNWKPR